MHRTNTSATRNVVSELQMSLRNELASYFVHVRQKACLRPELSPKFLSTLGPNPTRKALPDLQLCLIVITCSFAHNLHN